LPRPRAYAVHGHKPSCHFYRFWRILQEALNKGIASLFIPSSKDTTVKLRHSMADEEYFYSLDTESHLDCGMSELHGLIIKLIVGSDPDKLKDIGISSGSSSIFPSTLQSGPFPDPPYLEYRLEDGQFHDGRNYYQKVYCEKAHQGPKRKKTWSLPARKKRWLDMGLDIDILITARPTYDSLLIRTGFFEPTANAPTPACLGDFIKLFCGSVPNRFHGKFNRMLRVRISAIPQIEPKDVIWHLRDWRWSSELFRAAVPELSFLQEKISTLPNPSLRDDFNVALEVLRSLTLFMEDYKPPLDLLNRPPSWIPIATRLLALINCGLGASSYVWSLQNQTVVAVREWYNDLLGLVPISVWDRRDALELYVIDTVKLSRMDKQGYSLIAVNPMEDNFRSVGLYGTGRISLPSAWESLLS
jgi:hypothetical protein